MEWLLFRTAMISSAVESCRRKQLRMVVRKEHLSGTKMLQKLTEQRKMRLKALLQNRSSFDLQSRYSEARKVATQVVKMSKEYSARSSVVG